MTTSDCMRRGARSSCAEEISSLIALSSMTREWRSIWRCFSLAVRSRCIFFISPAWKRRVSKFPSQACISCGDKGTMDDGDQVACHSCMCVPVSSLSNDSCLLKSFREARSVFSSDFKAAKVWTRSASRRSLSAVVSASCTVFS